MWSIASQLLGEGEVIEPRDGATWRADVRCSLPLRNLQSLPQNLHVRRVSWVCSTQPCQPLAVGDAQPIDGELRMWAPERVRGVLCNLPHPPGAHESAESIAAAAHVDCLPFHLAVTALVDSCPEGGGGFTVWPRSHSRLFSADSRFGDVVSCADRGGPAGAVGDRVDGACHPELQATYATVQRAVQETLPPLEFHGAEGDVMFWHSQLFHARPENHSDPPQIRQAVIWDCAKRSIDDPHRPRELLQDPWHEWAACVRAAAAGRGRL